MRPPDAREFGVRTLVNRGFSLHVRRSQSAPGTAVPPLPLLDPVCVGFVSSRNMDFGSSCTKCSRCSHEPRPPLAVDEALAGIAHGRDVQLFCHMIV